MPHVVLLGDSIFDNASYVPDRPAMVEQLRRALPSEWRVTLLAVDGHCTPDVAGQLRKLPADASHLVVSVGGNDALSSGWILGQSVHSVDGALRLLQDVRTRFRGAYRAMLEALRATALPAVVCTVYDSVPDLGPAEQAALAGFNELILREAAAARLPIIDLRVLCDQPADYSHVSAIEPSAVGGLKISRVIAEVVTTHDFSRGLCVIYS
jgi:hypothetical protein